MHRNKLNNSSQLKFHEINYYTNNTAYEKALISKTENFLKRMRWKAFFFENNDAPEDKSKQNFGFKTANTPPQNPELVEFEEGIYKIISNLTYRTEENPFQKKLKEDTAKLKSSDKIIVEADKTNNIYLVDAAEYKRLRKDNITQSY